MRLWKLRKLAYGGLLLAALSFGFSQQAVSQTDTLERMEETLFEQLHDLKSSSHQLTEDLKKLQQELKDSRETSERLSSDLESTLTAFEKCAASLQTTKLKLQDKEAKLRKLTIILIVAGILAIAARGVILYLKAKGVEIPYIINTII